MGRQCKAMEASSVSFKVLFVKGEGDRSVASTDLFLAGVTCLTHTRGLLSQIFRPLGAQRTGLCDTVSKQAPGRAIECPTCLGLHPTTLLGPLPGDHNEQSWPPGLGEAPGFSPERAGTNH